MTVGPGVAPLGRDSLGQERSSQEPAAPRPLTHPETRRQVGALPALLRAEQSRKLQVLH